LRLPIAGPLLSLRGWGSREKSKTETKVSTAPREKVLSFHPDKTTKQNTTVFGYLHFLRMKEARRLLLEEDMTVNTTPRELIKTTNP
jgi:hypothetical protein